MEDIKEVILLAGNGHQIDTYTELDEENIGILPDGKIVDVLAVRYVSFLGSSSESKNGGYSYSFDIIRDGSVELYNFIKNQYKVIDEVRKQRLADKKSNKKWEQNMKMIGSFLLEIPDVYADFCESESIELFLYNFR